MAFASAHNSGPMGEMNSTPLIDVMLVLLVMMILTIPIATNSLEFDLPAQDQRPLIAPPPINPVKNKIVLTQEGAIQWNGAAVSERVLLDTLKASLVTFEREPELQFEPAALASYDLSARVLNIVKASGATNFGFVGNERYRDFGAAD